MAFPATPLPLLTELLIGGTWTTVSDGTPAFTDRRIADGLNMTRGRADWGSRIVYSRCGQVFENGTGKYSNRNPLSPYYGLIGRNTQLRHRIRMTRATFSVSASNAWPPCDTGETWTNTGGVAADFNGTGTAATHRLGSVNVKRRSSITTMTLFDIQVTASISATTTGGACTTWLNLQVDANNFYTCRPVWQTDGTVRLDLRKSVGGVDSVIGSTVVVGNYSPGTNWTFRLQWRHGGWLRAAAWLTSTNPTSTTWQISQQDTSLAGAAFTGYAIESRAETGNTNVNQTITYDDFEANSYRFWGETSAFSPEWDTSGRNVTVPVDAAGVLKRIGAGTPPQLSAMRRTILVNNPVAYYPLEDDPGATQFASALSGLPASAGTFIEGAQVNAAGSTNVPGSAPIPSLPPGGEIIVNLPAYTDTGTLTIHVATFVEALDANGSVVELRFTNGAKAQAVFIPGPSGGSLVLQATDPTGSVVINEADVVTSLADCVGRPIQMEIVAVLSTGRWTLRLRADNGTVLRTLTNTGGASAYGTLRKVLLEASDAGDSESITFGHLQQYTFDTSTSGGGAFFASTAVATAKAMSGHAGELGATRLNRLCTENGIAFELLGDPADTELMGPQGVKALLELLFEVPDADQGIMYEPRDSLAVGYRTKATLYNQSAVGLDYAAGHIAGVFKPFEDDQLLANDVTVSRANGSFARVQVTSGPLSIQNPPNGVGTYGADGQLNLYRDDQLESAASWIAAKGTWDEARYPTVTVEMANNEITNGSLVGILAALDLGDTMSVANPPAWIPPGAIGLMVQGTNEFVGDGMDWRITWNTVPSGPYNVFVIEDQTRGRLDTAGCILNEAVSSGATSLKLHTYSGPLWITTAGRPGDFPFNVGAAGEQLTVTAMGAVTAPTFVAAGTASTGANGPRTPGAPAGIAAGDLVLIFASTRNSGTGTVDTPANWRSLLEFGNCKLLGRIYDGVWSMPTVTYTGGAVNEDTIAQSCAFRGMGYDLSKIVVNSASRLNGSAQDIAAPNMTVRQDQCVILALGWKQDDYTSVAAISGYTEIQEASSIAGNDASQIWDYLIQTTQTDQDPKSFTVTGGAAAISRGALIALVGGYQTATVTRAVNGVAKAQVAGQAVSLWKPSLIAL